MCGAFTLILIALYGHLTVKADLIDNESIQAILKAHSVEIEKLKEIVAIQDYEIQRQSTEIGNLKHRVDKQERAALRCKKDIRYFQRVFNIQRQVLSSLRCDKRTSEQESKDTAQVRSSIHNDKMDRRSNYAPSITDDVRGKRLLLMNENTAVTTSGTRPAFTARLTNHIYALGTNQIVVFDDILTNIQNAYSSLTGVFTSPTNGTFFFYVSILNHQSHYIETEIVCNGVSTVRTYSYHQSLYNQGSNAVVLPLKSGDKVWVRHLNQEGDNVYGNSFSAFSGFQL